MRLCRVTFLLAIFLVQQLFSYVDDDLDGVEDAHDKCLYTPLSDLVNEEGCSVERLWSQQSFDLTLGLSYADTDYNTLAKTDTLTTAFALNYYHSKKLTFSLWSAYYTNSSESYSASGLNDTYASLEYLLHDDALRISLGAGVILPTYESTFMKNNTDFSMSLSLEYLLTPKTHLLASCGHTFINDTEMAGYGAFEDTSYFSLGAGYTFSETFYMSGAYNQSQSIYADVEDIATLSLSGVYEINAEHFMTFMYARGLSESASSNYLGLNFGYRF